MTFTNTDVERVRARVAQVVEDHRLPGIAVGVVSGRDLVWAEGFGYADIESGRAQDPALRQRIGSISKTMTALCVMALVDEGRLSLDDRVTSLLPDVPLHGHGESLTVWHMLTHTGGIGEAATMDDFQDPYTNALWANSPGGFTFPGSYPNGILVEVEPGTKWCYANHAYGLLGEIVARIEGQPIEEVLQKRIFQPLDMADTDCLDSQHPDLTASYHRAPDHDALDMADLLGNDVTPEDTVDGINIRGQWLYVGPIAAGAVQSTVHDMAKYAAALLDKSAGIVKPETFDNMISPHWSPDSRLADVGLCFMRQPRFGRFTYGHGGGIAGGWNTHITVVPEEDLVVLTHLNMAYDGFGEVEGSILQSVFDAAPLDLTNRTTNSGMLEAAPGVYGLKPGHLTNFRPTRGIGRVQIARKGDDLELTSRHGSWRNGVRMVQYSDDDPTYFILDTGAIEPPRVVLRSDDEGQVSELLLDRMVHMHRNDSLSPWT